jgi:3-oxoacyl-[acyl-carrier-protein] synthase II
VTSVGIGTKAVWEAIKSGTNGIGPITAFDATDFNCRIAGEVKGFNPGDYVEKKEIKKMGRFIQFAIAASEFALEGRIRRRRSGPACTSAAASADST